MVEPHETAAKEKTYEVARHFMGRFAALHGSIRCKDLLGLDLSEPGALLRAKELGFTAVGHISPFVPESPNMPHSQKMADAIKRVRAYREALGDGVDICVEIHRQLTPTEAIVLGRALEPLHPFFFEDPILPDSIDQMAFVASHINIPIATGERIHTIFEF
jgi:galactonate dehydratase